MYTIRELKPQDIEQYLTIYLNAYPAFKDLDAACYEEHRQRNLRNIQLPDVEYVGLFDGETLMASMKLVHFDMNLYGVMTPALGLMSLAVHPLHKKKGLALQMMKYYEDRAKELNSPVLPLLPFNITFYRNMGYGLGSKRALYHLPTVNLPKGGITRDLRFLNEDDFDAMIDCYTAAAAVTHGMIRKTGEELGDLRADEVTIRLGAFQDGRMTGYLAYRFENASETNFTQNRINVTELIHLDAETLTSFLEYLRRQADLAQSVKISSGDENFYHILSDPQDLSMEYLPYGYLQVSREFIGYMYKIVDYPEFFRLTADRPTGMDTVTARIEYEDAFAKAVRYLVMEAGGPQGGWRLLEQGTLAAGASADPAGASSDEAGASADVTIRCSESDLNALLMNAARLQPLYELGAVRTDDPAALRRLDATLYYSQKPYSNTDF
ncbi:MAG: GNAT family N-acetyltransferase [Firmicutes bacterium]|nr:GNAT family N-acetyltransferase [Bacillota bacterium]